MLIEHPRILDPNQSYTFRSYFELNNPPFEILADFGLTLRKTQLQLPARSVSSEIVQNLQTRIRNAILRTSLNSETARRETIVAPVLFEVAQIVDAQVNIEYPIKVNQYLKGEIDYYLINGTPILVVEAKNDDLTRGFTQLATELLAIYYGRAQQSSLYGAVTIGEAWQFGKLDMDTRTIWQDIRLQRVPDDLDELMRSLVGILTPDSQG